MPIPTSRQIVGVLLLAGACLSAHAARVDCATDVQAPLSIEVVNRSGKQDEQLVRKLETAACKASYGAMKEAASQGKHPEWIQGLLFVIVDDISGNKLEASFQRRFGGAPARWVDVTEPLLSTAPANQLVWTLGHELAHGVLKHQEVKKAIFVGGTTAALVGGMGVLAAKSFTHKIVVGVVAGVVGVGGAAA